MKIFTTIFAISMGIASFYLSALGVSVIFDVDLIYGFIIPLVAYFVFGLIPATSILQPIMGIILLIAPVVGLISLFN